MISRPSDRAKPGDHASADLVPLQVLDAFRWIRSDPRRFFPSGVPDSLGLLAYLMADVLELGRGSCTIRRMDGWWLIGSDADWFEGSPCSESDLFRRVVPAPEHGEHSMRGEVLLAAFASSVWTAREGIAVRIQGDEPPAGLWSHAGDLRRVIAFTMA
jgi:hypothetical protein